MITNHEKSNWYVVRTLPKHEAKVCERLAAKGFVVFLPMHASVRQWSDRKKTVKLPLVPGFVFLQCAQNELRLTYDTPGIHFILHEFGLPAVVLDAEIAVLKAVELEYMGIHSTDGIDQKEFIAGDEVRVCKGPFKGLFAKALDNGSKYRLLISIDLVQTNFTLSVPKSFVEKVNKERRA